MTTSQFVVREVKVAQVSEMARMQYDAFNDPTNTTPDEMSKLIDGEVDPETGRASTREEAEAKTAAGHLKLFGKDAYHIVGVYSVPSSSAGEKGEEEEGILAGFAIWRHIQPSSALDSSESDQKVQESPTLTNRFFAQMNRTREQAMKAKTYWFLKLLVIDPKFQRKGLGTLLVKWGTNQADQEGADAWLESSPMGKGAYLKAGFRVLGMDRIPEPMAKRGYLEWPYMIHDCKAKQQQQ